MKLGNITRTFLKVAAALHRAALNRDCNAASGLADRHFDRAANQLELVNFAKAHLNKLQDEALELRAAAQREHVKAYDEMRGRIDCL